MLCGSGGLKMETTRGSEEMEPTGKIEQFNSTVRGVVTLLLTLGFIIGFFKELIDGGVYANIFGVAVAFWFASRTADKVVAAIKTFNGGTSTTETKEIVK